MQKKVNRSLGLLERWEQGKRQRATEVLALLFCVFAFDFLLLKNWTQASPMSLQQQRMGDRTVCPTDLETLIQQMLQDLPGYTNRVIQRARLPNQPYTPIYLLTAGRPEFEPLPLSLGGSSTDTATHNRRESDPTRRPDTLPSIDDGKDAGPTRDRAANEHSEHDQENPNPTAKSSDNDPRQVFITTLERQYIDNNIVLVQRYHWLFLTQTTDGWWLTLMFSRSGPYPANQPSTPPEESSDSATGQAIRLWLRDCRAR